MNANSTVAFIRVPSKYPSLQHLPSRSLSTYSGLLLIFIISVRTFVSMISLSARHIRPKYSTFTWFVYLQYVWFSNILDRSSFFLLSNGVYRLMLYTPGYWAKNVSQNVSFFKSFQYYLYFYNFIDLQQLYEKNYIY